MQIVGAEPSAGAPERGGRILVMDADESIARTIGAVLRQNGCDVVTTTTDADALARLRGGQFDLLLADLRSEDPRSIEIPGRVRRVAPGTLVIVLARYAAIEAALRALRAGAYAYLLQPIDVEELRATVARGLEHRRLEQALDQAQEQVRSLDDRLRRQVDDATGELRRRVEALDTANRQLQQAQDEHERFIAMVAHEMRGPLNPIINYAQLAKRPTITSEMLDHYTDLIIEHAFRLNRLVDDLQTATRLSTGQFALRRERCDVAAAVSEVIDHFTATVRERTFSLKRPDAALYAEVDRDRVIQAVRNLLDNAVKYSVEGGAVDTTIWSDSDCTYIRVRDHGAGIPEEDMARIFDAFTRLGKRDNVAGSGLGLFITRGIVAAHGGELAVANGSGPERARGAIFTITLPLRIASAVTERATAPQ